MKCIPLLLLIITLTASQTDKVLVCVSTGATKYHSHYCQGLKKCTHRVEEVSKSEAIKRGYTACGYCY